MKLVVYTDALTRENVGLYNALILSDKCFIAYESELSNSSNATENELLAVLLAVRAIFEMDAITGVTVYTDSESICRYVEVLREDPSRWVKVKYKDVWEEIFEKTAHLEFHMVWVKGHQGEINPNVFCDKRGKAEYDVLRLRLSG
jgi:ribonuclease HI